MARLLLAVAITAGWLSPTLADDPLEDHERETRAAAALARAGFADPVGSEFPGQTRQLGQDLALLFQDLPQLARDRRGVARLDRGRFARGGKMKDENCGPDGGQAGPGFRVRPEQG